jgi:hypothetical protein
VVLFDSLLADHGGWSADYNPTTKKWEGSTFGLCHADLFQPLPIEVIQLDPATFKLTIEGASGACGGPFTATAEGLINVDVFPTIGNVYPLTGWPPTWGDVGVNSVGVYFT